MRSSSAPPVTPSDWTPVVLLVCSLSLALAALAWVLPRWLPGREGAEPGVEMAEHAAPAEVVLWVYEMPERGLKVALSAVWGDEGPDQSHDLTLQARLELPRPTPPAWYRLLLFNTSDVVQKITAAELPRLLEGADGPAQRQNVLKLLEEAGVSPARGVFTLLQSLGALREEVELPARGSVPLLLCFDRRVDLARATAVAGADGVRFRRRPIERARFQRLLADPDEDLVRDL